MIYMPTPTPTRSQVVVNHDVNHDVNSYVPTTIVVHVVTRQATTTTSKSIKVNKEEEYNGEREREQK